MTSNLTNVAKNYNSVLVEELKGQGFIKTSKVEDAFATILRDQFIEHYYEDRESTGHWQLVSPAKIQSESWLKNIYANKPLVVKLAQFGIPIIGSTAPWLMALMLESLEIQPSMHVLEIGTGTGYNAALIAHIVGRPDLVSTIEIDKKFAENARTRIAGCLGEGMTIVVDDGFLGYLPNAPYDRIIATCSHTYIPPSWLDQLSPNGVLIMNIRGDMAGGIVRLTKDSNGIMVKGKFLEVPDSVGFMPLTSATTIISLPHHGITFKNGISNIIDFGPTIFNPQLLDNFDFLFFLQFNFPYMNLIWMRKNNEDSISIPCLIDKRDKTSIEFLGRTDAESEWRAKITGDINVWYKLSHVYQNWLMLNNPSTTDYSIEVDSSGEQYISVDNQRLRIL
jgi:protein-L-isoaspartate(D-aspartate) O-methyltransferase